MNEVKRAITVLKKIQLDCSDQRNTPLGRYLTSQRDFVVFDSFDLYFNRQKSNEQIDMQVGNNTFNLCAWGASIHKLAELLLLKGASIEDIELLGERVTQRSADNS